jgi:hypothetical protein
VALKSMVVWIPLTALNFYFVPKLYRTVVTATATVCWSAYTSIVLHR